MEIHTSTHNGVDILHLSQRFDAHTAPVVANALEAHDTQGRCHLVIDMEAIQFIDSTGLSTLVTGMKHARAHGGDVRLAALQTPVLRIFELTRLDRAFQIYPTVRDAVNSFTA